jgi:hypothetical protein
VAWDDVRPGLLSAAEDVEPAPPLFPRIDAPAGA